MSIGRYRVTVGRVVVTARSKIHDSRAEWTKMEGTLELELPKATGELQLDMRVFESGDALKNWKLRADLKPDEHPRATFQLERFEDLRENVDERSGIVMATAVGTLRWRDHQVAIRAKGKGTLGDTIYAEATFDLNMRDLGITPPKVLILRVEDVVRVDVKFEAQLN